MDYQAQEKGKLRKMIEKYHQKRGKEFPDATKIYEREIKPFYFLETKIKKIIDSTLEPMVLRLAYLSFARQIFKLLREKKEEKLPSIFSLWEKRGLKREIMEKIFKICKEQFKKYNPLSRWAYPP